MDKFALAISLLIILASQSNASGNAKGCLQKAIRIKLSLIAKDGIQESRQGLTKELGYSKDMSWEEREKKDERLAEIDFYRAKKATDENRQRYCHKSGGHPRYEQSRHQLERSQALILKQLKKDGKVSGTFLNGILEFEFEDGKTYTEKEICQKLTEVEKKTLGDDGECPEAKVHTKRLATAYGYENMDFRSACEVWIKEFPNVINAYEGCEKESKTTKREAPGEEIAPAEEPKEVKKSISDFKTKVNSQGNQSSSKSGRGGISQ